MLNFCFIPGEMYAVLMACMREAVACVHSNLQVRSTPHFRYVFTIVRVRTLSVSVEVKRSREVKLREPLLNIATWKQRSGEHDVNRGCCLNFF